ncbi:hypothetical protein Scep_018869 [Stephania cephalantha]|uniref:Dof zinc finger protein n=1 Tax=Stephania cephalantha TaxID=152367 RepID=A0AAP0I9W1_9MAGN
MLSPPSPSIGSSGGLTVDRRWKANIEIAPNCPRCASTNTKFCYYNNYSLSQPRYFCKACRRYWTKGGSLRNVPFGGGCRKSRRSSKASSLSSSSIGHHHQEQQLPSSPFLEDDDLNDPVENSMAIGAASSTSNHHIDLADVFSKFLSHGDHQQVHEHRPLIDHFSNSSCSTTTTTSYGTALSSPIDHFEHHQHEHPNEIEMISSLNLVMEEQERSLMVPQIVGGTDHDQGLSNNEGLMQDLMSNVNAFGIHHHEEDISWSDVNSGSSFDSWQQMQFPHDHQMCGSDDADVAVEDDNSLLFLPTPLQSNWSSFDIPNYGS